MKKQLTLFICLFITTFLFSQEEKIDSLKNILKTSIVDTIRLNSYFSLTSIYGGQDIELAQKYLDTMMALSIQKKLKKHELTGNSQKGILSFRQGNVQEAINTWKNALLDKDIDKYPIQKGNYFNNIAVGYKSLKENDSVIIYFLKSIKLNEKLKNNLGLIANYFSISDFYFSIEDYDNSIKYLEKLQALALNTNDSLALARTNILLASISRKEYDFKDAIKYFEKALNYYKLKEPQNIIMLRGLRYEITKTKLRENKYKEVTIELSKLKKDYQEKLPDQNFWLEVDIDLLISYSNLHELDKAYQAYLRLKKSEIDTREKIQLVKLLALSNFEIISNRMNDQTLNQLNNALANSIKLNDLQNEFLSNKYLAFYYIKKNNYKEAYNYLNKTEILQDSLSFTETKIINLSLKRDFNEALKEKENLSLKQQNAEQALLTEKEKNQKWAIGSGLGVSLAGLGIFFIAYRKNKKQKKEIEKQKNLVEELQRELHHRLKNNLSFIDFFITLAKGKFPDPAYREKLDELQNRINSMFEIHKQLFKKQDVTSVNAQTYISALVENVKKAYTAPNVTLVENVKDTNLRSDISFPIGLIVNEFITNSYKYAFPNNTIGIISIGFQEDKENYHLSLVDNGKGLPNDFEIDALNSFGMETIKLLTQEYKGTFKLDGSAGVKMNITFPKTAA